MCAGRWGGLQDKVYLEERRGPGLNLTSHFMFHGGSGGGQRRTSSPLNVPLFMACMPFFLPSQTPYSSEVPPSSRTFHPHRPGSSASLCPSVPCAAYLSPYHTILQISIYVSESTSNLRVLCLAHHCSPTV